MAGRALSRLAALALAAVVATYALIVLGGVVRATGSGFGCPDWPLCHGRLIPPFEFHILIEYSHRLVTLMVSGLILALAVAVLLGRRRKKVILTSILAVAFLANQVVLGAITVLWELPSTVVTMHLANAMALLAVLVVLATLLALGGESSVGSEGGYVRAAMPGGFPWLALGAAMATYTLILSGSYVVGSGASLACSSWPLCLDRPSGAPAYPVDINMLHRIVAAVVGALIVATVVQAVRTQRHNRAVMASVCLAGVLLVIQGGVGAVGVTSHWPAGTEALHLALATAIWGALVAITTLSFIGESVPKRRGLARAVHGQGEALAVGHGPLPSVEG